MSESAPEPAPRPSGGPSILTRQYGPLPLWAWLAIGLAAAIGYKVWQSHSASSKTAADTSGTATDTSSQVPQFVNQTYVNPSPPSPTAGPPPTQPGTATAPEKYSAPTGLAYKKLSGTSVRLTWNAITNVSPKPTSYTIVAKSPENALVSQTTVNASDTGGGTMTATLSGLPTGKQLTYYVYANGSKAGSPAAKIGGVA